MHLDPVTVITSLIALVLALTLHEFAHAWVGDYLGDTTARVNGRLTINPISHIDPFTTLLLPLFLILVGSPVVFGAAKPVPFNPWALRGGRFGAAMVAFAGPATNLFLAAFFALWLRVVPAVGFSANLLLSMVLVNAGFFVFNMIPFPPLDGSRLLYAVAPKWLRDVMDQIEQGGIVLLFLFLFIGYQFIAAPIARITLALVNVLIPGSTLP